MEKRWVLHADRDQDSVKNLSSELNISTHLAALLVTRGISTFDKAKQFFRGGLKDLHDPFLMKGMDKAVNRLGEAISDQQRILVYGDYDVDGTTSVAMVYDFLIGIYNPSKLDYYIPDRYSEGYGLSEKGVTWAANNNISLIITLDCGIKAHKIVSLANSQDIDVIICDHHLPSDTLPPAFAVLDPKQSDCNYPYKELSGCGVGFKMLQGFCIQNTIDSKYLFNYLDLLATSIACDIVPITGENRILARYGLHKINRNPSPGIKSLIEVARLRNEIKVSDLVFYIGPRINAMGRLKHAKESVRLLAGGVKENLAGFANDLDVTNQDRKDYDHQITEMALEMIKSDESSKDRKSTVLFDSNWHKGVVGIVASRCTEHYYKPTIILTESNGKATGSARSVEGFDINSAISHCHALLDQYGGHRYAAGLSLPLENVEAFKVAFEKTVAARISKDQLIPKLYVDAEVELDFIRFKVFDIIQQMGPFGPNNQNPCFLTKGLSSTGRLRIIKEDHVKMSVTKNGFIKEAIAFNAKEWIEQLQSGLEFDALYNIEINDFRGYKTLQLVIKDLKFKE